MKMESLRQLFIEELQDLYSAELQITEALPKMAEKAQSPELKNAFLEHLKQTEGHIRRLDQIFDQLKDVDREDKKCKGMEGIIKDGEEVVKAKGESEVRDAGMISAAQHVEHYEMAGYGTARTFADILGHPEWARLLEETLDEEKETDSKLTVIASRINIEAKAA